MARAGAFGWGGNAALTDPLDINGGEQSLQHFCLVPGVDTPQDPIFSLNYPLTASINNARSNRQDEIRHVRKNRGQ